jgi:hypothetical protein
MLMSAPRNVEGTMTSIQPSFQRSHLAGCKQFEVPRNEIDQVGSRLAKHGITFTSILGQEEKALIEVADDVQAEAIVAALA